MAAAGGLQELNTAPRKRALRLLEPLVEQSAWVAERVVDARPFASDQDVAQQLVDAIFEAGFEERVALFRAHPELAGREATEGTMTEASTTEQSRLGLTSLAPDVSARLAGMNVAYADRFGHPFILALHRVPDLASVFEVFERRLAASPVEEHVTTLAEITSVICARAARAFAVPSQSTATSNPVEAANG